MNIDLVSQHVVTLALYVDDLIPGSVSEIWLDKEIVDTLKHELPTEHELEKYVENMNVLIDELDDVRRSSYLLKTVQSLLYQLEHRHDARVDLEVFSLNCFGVVIPRYTESDIQRCLNTIAGLEMALGKKLSTVLSEHKLEKEQIEPLFEKHLADAKRLVNQQLDTPSVSEQFLTQMVSGEAWSAFNKHVAPFTSQLMINTDYPVTSRGVRYLSFHEGYGGHHTELCLKDQLLVKEGRGEHGLVITYSPQTFVSEAIAVNSQEFFDTEDASIQTQLLETYDQLTGGILLNVAAYMFYEDGKSREEIKKYLTALNIEDESIRFILDFATDHTYGKYTLVYEFAGAYLHNIYERSSKKDVLLNEIYTQPTSPDMLVSE